MSFLRYRTINTYVDKHDEQQLWENYTKVDSPLTELLNEREQGFLKNRAGGNWVDRHGNPWRTGRATPAPKPTAHMDPNVPTTGPGHVQIGQGTRANPIKIPDKRGWLAKQPVSPTRQSMGMGPVGNPLRHPTDPSTIPSGAASNADEVDAISKAYTDFSGKPGEQEALDKLTSGTGKKIKGAGKEAGSRTGAISRAWKWAKANKKYSIPAALAGTAALGVGGYYGGKKLGLWGKGKPDTAAPKKKTKKKTKKHVEKPGDLGDVGK
jgi:hypothetical protein